MISWERVGYQIVMWQLEVRVDEEGNNRHLIHALVYLLQSAYQIVDGATGGVQEWTRKAIMNI